MARYLVTGGAGFIGSNLAKRLLAKGHQVRIIDNFSTGKRERIPKGAVVVEADIRDRLGMAFAFQGIDGVFHCAALPRVPLSIQQPALTNEINVNGTVNVLLAAKDAKVKRVVYSASSSAYGAQPQMPMHPDMPANPPNPYGLQKYIGELYCKQFSNVFGLETVALRYFNVYGPDMADEGAYVTVISIFKNQALSGKPLTIQGDGTKTRDFTHVFDVADANIAAMESPKVGKGEVLNVGFGQEQSLTRIASFFEGYPAINVPIPPEREHEALRTLADTSRTRELTGWEPKISIDEGLPALLKEWGLRS